MTSGAVEASFASEPAIFNKGLALITALSKHPFDYYRGYIVSENLEGVPYLVGNITEQEFDADSEYVIQVRSGFLSELRWPGFRKSDYDDTPTAEYLLPEIPTLEAGIVAQLSVSGVLDKGALGPFGAGHFVWNENGQVIHYSVQDDFAGGIGLPVGVILSNVELFNLNRAIASAYNSAYEFEHIDKRFGNRLHRRMNVATVLGRLMHGDGDLVGDV